MLQTIQNDKQKPTFLGPAFISNATIKIQMCIYQSLGSVMADSMITHKLADS